MGKRIGALVVALATVIILGAALKFYQNAVYRKNFVNKYVKNTYPSGSLAIAAKNLFVKFGVQLPQGDAADYYEIMIGGVSPSNLKLYANLAYPKDIYSQVEYFEPAFNMNATSSYLVDIFCRSKPMENEVVLNSGAIIPIQDITSGLSGREEESLASDFAEVPPSDQWNYLSAPKVSADQVSGTVIMAVSYSSGPYSQFDYYVTYKESNIDN